MKFIKKHKYPLLIALVFLILFIFAFIGLKNLLIPDSDIDKYGDRLEGIEDHPIKDEMINNVKKVLEETGKINEITYRLEGKIMLFTIDVKKGLDKKNMEALGEKILQNIEEDIKGFYDIHLTVTCVEDEEFIPKMASKHKTGKVFVWWFYE